MSDTEPTENRRETNALLVPPALIQGTLDYNKQKRRGRSDNGKDAYPWCHHFFTNFTKR